MLYSTRGNMGNKEFNKLILKPLKAYRPEKVVLFGSCARGDINENSDVDLLIVKNTKRKFLNRIEDVLNLFDPKLHIEPIVYTPCELQNMIKRRNDFILTVLREGKTIYEKQ